MPGQPGNTGRHHLQQSRIGLPWMVFRSPPGQLPRKQLCNFMFPSYSSSAPRNCGWCFLRGRREQGDLTAWTPGSATLDPGNLGFLIRGPGVTLSPGSDPGWLPVWFLYTQASVCTYWASNTQSLVTRFPKPPACMPLPMGLLTELTRGGCGETP